jgi:hypothetical protein
MASLAHKITVPSAVAWHAVTRAALMANTGTSNSAPVCVCGGGASLVWNGGAPLWVCRCGGPRAPVGARDQRPARDFVRSDRAPLFVCVSEGLYGIRSQGTTRAFDVHRPQLRTERSR